MTNFPVNLHQFHLEQMWLIPSSFVHKYRRQFLHWHTGSLIHQSVFLVLLFSFFASPKISRLYYPHKQNFGLLVIVLKVIIGFCGAMLADIGFSVPIAPNVLFSMQPTATARTHCISITHNFDLQKIHSTIGRRYNYMNNVLKSQGSALIFRKPLYFLRYYSIINVLFTA